MKIEALWQGIKQSTSFSLVHNIILFLSIAKMANNRLHAGLADPTDIFPSRKQTGWILASNF